MTDTDRIESDPAGDEVLDEWDEYDADEGAELRYRDFLDWLNDQG